MQADASITVDVVVKDSKEFKLFAERLTKIAQDATPSIRKRITEAVRDLYECKR